MSGVRSLLSGKELSLKCRTPRLVRHSAASPILPPQPKLRLVYRYIGLALQVSRFSLAKQLILWEAAGKRETQLLEKGTPRNTLEAG